MATRRILNGVWRSESTLLSHFLALSKAVAGTQKETLPSPHWPKNIGQFARRLTIRLIQILWPIHIALDRRSGTELRTNHLRAKAVVPVAKLWRKRNRCAA